MSAFPAELEKGVRLWSTSFEGNLGDVEDTKRSPFLNMNKSPVDNKKSQLESIDAEAVRRQKRKVLARQEDLRLLREIFEISKQILLWLFLVMLFVGFSPLSKALLESVGRTAESTNSSNIFPLQVIAAGCISVYFSSLLQSGYESRKYRYREVLKFLGIHFVGPKELKKRSETFAVPDPTTIEEVINISRMFADSDFKQMVRKTVRAILKSSSDTITAKEIEKQINEYLGPGLG